MDGTVGGSAATGISGRVATTSPVSISGGGGEVAIAIGIVTGGIGTDRPHKPGGAVSFALGKRKGDLPSRRPPFFVPKERLVAASGRRGSDQRSGRSGAGPRPLWTIEFISTYVRIIGAHTLWSGFFASSMSWSAR